MLIEYSLVVWKVVNKCCDNCCCGLPAVRLDLRVQNSAGVAMLGRSPQSWTPQSHVSARKIKILTQHLIENYPKMVCGEKVDILSSRMKPKSSRLSNWKYFYLMFEYHQFDGKLEFQKLILINWRPLETFCLSR